MLREEMKIAPAVAAATIILLNLLVFGNLQAADALPLNSSSDEVEEEPEQFSWDIATDNIAAYSIIPLLDLDSMVKEASAAPEHSRQKRASKVAKRVHHAVASSNMRTMPYFAAVRINRGCSGTLISPHHVLTAAHCLHNGRQYKFRLSQIRVGLMKGIRQFAWKRVTHIHISKSWKASRGRKGKNAVEGDFAVLKLKSAHGLKHLKPRVSRARLGSTIKFNGFPVNKNGALWHSSCPVEKVVSSGINLSRCAASKGTSGSGLYDSLPFGGYGVTGVVSAAITVRNGKHTYSYTITNKLTPSKVRKICRWAGRNDC